MKPHIFGLFFRFAFVFNKFSSLLTMKKRKNIGNMGVQMSSRTILCCYITSSSKIYKFILLNTGINY